MTMTLTQLQSSQPVSLTTVAQFTTPSASIGHIASAAPVAFSTVSATESVTNESLNRNATSLATSINAVLSTLSSNTDAKVQEVVSALNTALSTLTTDINSSQTAAFSNMQLLQSSVNDAQTKLSLLDDVMETDADFLAKLAQLNTTISALNNTGGTTITALNGIVSAMNAEPLLYRRSVNVNTASGLYNYNYAGENIPTGDAIVNTQEVNAPLASASVTSQTVNGFTISVKSKGVHFTPQPVDCSSIPVTVNVTITRDRASIPAVPT